MTVLIAQKTARGWRCCDAKCYNAKGDGECICICGGINHGVGIEQAFENTLDLLESEELDDEIYFAPKQDNFSPLVDSA